MKKILHLDLKSIRIIVSVIFIFSLFILNTASVYSYIVPAPDYCINQDLFIPDQEWIREGVVGSNLSDPVKFCTEICLSRYKCDGYGYTAREKVCQEIEDPCIPADIISELWKAHEARCYESCKNKYFGFKIDGDSYSSYNSEARKGGDTNNENDNLGDIDYNNNNLDNALIGLPFDSSTNAIPCVGETPKNSKACSGDDEEVFYFTQKEMVESCSIPKGSEPKCEYVCKGGYNFVDGECESAGFFARVLNWLGSLFLIVKK